MKHKTMRRIPAFLLTLLLLLTQTRLALADEVYSLADVAVINAIIQNNGLMGYTPDEPDDWPEYDVIWDASLPKRIVELYLVDEGLTGDLDVSGLEKLVKFYCQENDLTTLDVSGCEALELLECQGNNLTTLDVSGLTALEVLNCQNNNLTTLDVSGCVGLKELFCFKNNLTSLDVSDCDVLTQLYCQGNNLTALDVSGFEDLVHLDCSNNNLTTLDVSDCDVLTQLECQGNNLTTLDVSELTALEVLYCQNNNLTTLDVSGCVGLDKLFCFKNNLTTLDVSDCTLLIKLDCANNNLTSLDVRGCDVLNDLYCANNNLTYLDVSDCEYLDELDCANNNLTSLNLEACQEVLEYLFFNGCPMSKTEISGLPDEFSNLKGMAYTDGDWHHVERNVSPPYELTINSGIILNTNSISNNNVFDVYLRAPQGYLMADKEEWEWNGETSVADLGNDRYKITLSGSPGSVNIPLTPMPGPPPPPPRESEEEYASSDIIAATPLQSGTHWLEAAETKALANAARGRGGNTAAYSREGSTGIRGGAAGELKGLKFRHDTTANGAVRVRLEFNDPARITKDTLLSGFITGGDVEKINALFERFFRNRLRVVYFEQQGDWGQNALVAAKIDLTGMNTKNLYFYAYDQATNTYRQIGQPGYWIDRNGYLHFSTPYAGSIIISEGPLAKWPAGA